LISIVVSVIVLYALFGAQKSVMRARTTVTTAIIAAISRGVSPMNKMGALIKQKLRLQAKLYELTESHELTSEAVVRCSRELDKVIVQLQRRCAG
jgi:NRPS condensation-like uncharacterized protein